MSKKVLALVVLALLLSLCLPMVALAAANSSEAIKGTPAIDAKIDAKWKNAKSVKTDKWSSEEGDYATAKVRTMWDEKYFYVLAEVTDKKLSDKSSNPWEKDSVEVFFDEKNEKASEYDSNDGQYRVNYKNETSGGGAFAADTLKSAAATTDTGYIVEMGIPWVALKGSVSVGTVVGFDVQVNDDSLGMGLRSGIVCWNDNAGDKYCNASTLGDIKLVEAPASTAAALPTTGSYIPTPVILAIGLCLLAGGALLVLRKKKVTAK